MFLGYSLKITYSFLLKFSTVDEPCIDLHWDKFDPKSLRNEKVLSLSEKRFLK